MASCIVVTALLLWAAATDAQRQGNLRTNTQQRRRALQDTPTPDCNPVTVNFNTAANGTPLVGGEYVENEWLDYGMMLTASGGVGTLPRLFDTATPRGPDESGGDPDLGSPNEFCPVPGPGIGQGGALGQEGENCEFLGNVLIVQEPNESPDIPDDNGDGGTINFIFPTGVYVFEMGLLDVDDDITLIVNEQDEIAAALLGDNSYQTVPIMTDDVTRIESVFHGSGAVTHIKFCPVPPIIMTEVPTNAPTPASTCLQAKISFEYSAQGIPLQGGDYVQDEWREYGLTLSSSGETGLPRLFDTSVYRDPTLDGGDSDLGSPNEACRPPGPGRGEGGAPGKEGENCEPLGNVLIVQEEGVEIPDDSGAGGEIVFDFLVPATTVDEMGFLDIEEATRVVVTHGPNGSQTVFDLPLLGNNSKQTLEINLENVQQIRVEMSASGAVTFLSFCYVDGVQTGPPAANPTLLPSPIPTSLPSAGPTASPTSAAPTSSPTSRPSPSPTVAPSASPTRDPTGSPTPVPTVSPSKSPTREPTAVPTAFPTPVPTLTPSQSPTREPTAAPTRNPTLSPTLTPSTANPTDSPSASPTQSPTDAPTASPTASPTEVPTAFPTLVPTLSPSKSPTRGPTASPTRSPTAAPTASPTPAPSALSTAFSMLVPTDAPTASPTRGPTTAPTISPTRAPIVAMPSKAPMEPPTPRTCTEEEVMIDFDTDADGFPLSPGRYVGKQWSKYGLTLSASGGLSELPRLFDTANPWIEDTGGDRDLGAPNWRCDPPGPGRGEGGEPGEPGENCVPLGNVLIIQEEDTPIPDDNFQGGMIVFDFEEPVEYVSAMGLLDVDEEAVTLVVSHMVEEGMMTTVLEVPQLGDNSKQTLEIDIENVIQLKLTLERSGAVTFLSFCPGTGTPPQPSPYILDFETAADGTTIPPGAYLETEWEEIGVSISATGGFGSLPRAFDTENPGDSTELGTPNERCTPEGQGPGVGEGGEPDTQGENCSPLGNVLIVEAVGDQSVVVPSKGAVMIELEFIPVAPRVYEVGLLNIDGKTTVTAVYATGEGAFVDQTFDVDALGPNSYQTLNINLPNVRMLTVSTENGGAVAFISFDPPLEPGVPTQAPVDVPPATLPPTDMLSLSMPTAPIPLPTEPSLPTMGPTTAPVVAQPSKAPTFPTMPPVDLSMSMMSMPTAPIPSPTEATTPSEPTTLPPTRAPIVAQPSKAPTSPPSVVLDTVIEVLAKDNRFSTLVSLVSAVGLLPALEEEPELTVFAPANEAFEALDLPSDTPPEVLSEVLLNHFVRGNVPTENVAFMALNGEELLLTATPTGLKINGVDISGGLPASNGIVIVIESVLIPPTDEPTVAPISSTPEPTQGLDKITIDFETSDNGMPLVPGLYVENEWSKYGLILSASGGEGSLPRLFDTSSPGPDPDLGSPNEKCTPSGPGIGEGGVPGTNGENCEPLGNVLIIQQPDISIPNDNVDGGEIVFDFFTSAKMVYSMGFVDIDYATSVEVEHRTQMGILSTFFDLELLGDNSKQELMIDIENVLRIKVKLTRSGAVTFITFGMETINPM